MYGLKQASRAWHKTVDALLKALGFKRSESDPSLYILETKSGLLFVLVYVDDMLLVGKIQEELRAIAERIGKRVEIRIEPDVAKFLGIINHRNRVDGTLQLSSPHMISEMLHKFEIQNASVSSTPLPPGTAFASPVVTDEGESRDDMASVPYRQLVGALLHLSNTTRPDIAFATSYLSRFIQNPNRDHWNAAKHVLRYLKKTIKSGISYTRSSSAFSVHGYTDSDFAGDRIDRKSTSGHVFLTGGGAVAWRSKKQKVVAQSTVEAEYIATSFAVREALWLQRLAMDLCPTVKGGILLYSDNQGSIALGKNDVTNERSKHIDVKFHFIKDHIQKRNVIVEYISTNQMAADAMTKSLPRIKHEKFSKMMGVNVDHS